MLFATVVFILYRTIQSGNKEHGKTISAQVRDIQKILIISGIIQPQKEIEIKSTISGVLERLSVRIGDEVLAGQDIASVQYVKDPMAHKQLLKELEITRTRLDNALTKFQSTKELYNKRLIAPLDYENEKNEVAIFRSEFEAVKSELNMLRGIYQGKDVSNIITATGNGTILELPIKEGGSVMARGTLSEGTTIARLADMRSLVFKGDVLESDVLTLRIGMPVKFTLATDKDIPFKGNIEMIAPKGVLQDGVSRFQITASIEIPNVYRKYIRAGCTANATVVIEKRRKVLALEEKYFQFSYDSVYVEVKTFKDKYERRYLETGLSDGIYTEIVRGINAIDKIKIKEKDK